MLLQHAIEQTPADSPSKPMLSRALRAVRRALDEGRAAIGGLQVTLPEPSSLEQAFATFLEEVAPAPSTRLRLFVRGKAMALKAAVQEQLLLIGREAVMNALRHSEATEIEVEIQYLPHLVCILIRDNGCGFSTGAVPEGSNSHWGLCGMRERAVSIGARFSVWSKQQSGTEVRAAVPAGAAAAGAQD